MLKRHFWGARKAVLQFRGWRKRFTDVTVKNAVFWDIKPQFVPQRRHIASLLQSPTGYCYVRFEALTVVTTKNAVFWYVMPYSSYTNRYFRGIYHLHHQSDKNRRPRNDVGSN
jgi:hypothetical protein